MWSLKGCSGSVNDPTLMHIQATLSELNGSGGGERMKLEGEVLEGDRRKKMEGKGGLIQTHHMHACELMQLNG